MQAPARVGLAASPDQLVVLPAECVTKTAIRPLAVPSWVFVLNFDVIQAGDPVGCMLIFRMARVPSDAISIPCTAVGVGVAFVGGEARLTGGHVRCPINVNAAFASLTPPIIQNQTSYDYPFFTIVGVGRLDPTNILTEPFSNPLVHYGPGDPGAPDLGFFVPLSNTPSAAVMTSVFNGVTNTGRVPIQLIAGGGAVQTWSVKHEGIKDVYTITHAYNGSIVQAFAPRKPVTFWTAGGVFRIGASPYGPSFRGTLDEVVIDPPDGGIPPLFAPVAF
jgi:hypothetical protein